MQMLTDIVTCEGANIQREVLYSRQRLLWMSLLGLAATALMSNEDERYHYIIGAEICPGSRGLVCSVRGRSRQPFP